MDSTSRHVFPADSPSTASKNVPEAARGVRWDDPAFGIEWPAADQRIISDRDEAWPDHARSGPTRT